MQGCLDLNFTQVLNMNNDFIIADLIPFEYQKYSSNCNSSIDICMSDIASSLINHSFKFLIKD